MLTHMQKIQKELYYNMPRARNYTLEQSNYGVYITYNKKPNRIDYWMHAWVVIYLCMLYVRIYLCHS